ncbi:hypothetical protein BCR44DRAFT_1201110 [Catenaria anguillulae PL171]|uniref:Uncharacterized protein n=1 Tax=Catenaria anguillulae PL171 TaxID=765915 RepID=A0A1Y2HH69_9FUNG|nr:hypothetical protein BCR44DRAFT_1201110 [Catenaria anguillulae PL171]
MSSYNHQQPSGSGHGQQPPRGGGLVVFRKSGPASTPKSNASSPRSKLGLDALAERKRSESPAAGYQEKEKIKASAQVKVKRSWSDDDDEHDDYQRQSRFEPKRPKSASRSTMPVFESAGSSSTSREGTPTPSSSGLVLRKGLHGYVSISTDFGVRH